VHYALHASMPYLMQNSLATALNTLKVICIENISFNLLDVVTALLLLSTSEGSPSVGWLFASKGMLCFKSNWF